MTNKLVPIDPCVIKDNVFNLIGNDWMLITAGTLKSFNMMTASWGTMGELWNRKVCFCFVRPTRHTYQFITKAETFTLCFFDESYRETLNLCGSKSGRDIDKVAATGLTPVATEYGSVYFEQARLVLECRILYTHDFDPERFIDSKIHDSYPEKDYHRMFVGEVIRCLARPER